MRQSTDEQLATRFRIRFPDAGEPTSRDLLLMGMGRRSAQVRARAARQEHPDLPAMRELARWLAGQRTDGKDAPE